MVAEANGLVSPDDMQAILKKDAVYNAVGLCAFDMYDEVNMDPFFFRIYLSLLKSIDENVNLIT